MIRCWLLVASKSRRLLVELGRCLEILIPHKAVQQSGAPKAKDADGPGANEEAGNCPEGAHQLVLGQGPDTPQAHAGGNHEASNAVVGTGIREERVFVGRQHVRQADDFARHPIVEPGHCEEDATKADDRLPDGQSRIVDDHVDLRQEPCRHGPQDTLKTHGHLHDRVVGARHLEPLEREGACNHREGDDERDARKHVAPVGHDHHGPRRHGRVVRDAHPEHETLKLRVCLTLGDIGS